MIDKRGTCAEFADVPGGNHRPTPSLTESDDQVEQMSHALNRLRAMVSLPKYSPPMRSPPTGDRGWMA